MTEYLVIHDYGYEGDQVIEVDGEDELYIEMQNPTFTYAFPLELSIDAEQFQKLWEAENERRHEKQKQLVAQAKAKLTAEEIEALGL